MISTLIPMFLHPRKWILSLLAAVSATSAAAHSVWIENSDGKLVVRFGEIGEKYEKSPGYLDQLSLPKISTPADGKIAVEKAPDGFLLKDAAAAQPAVVSTMFPVMEKAATETKPASARWPQFYARWWTPGTAAEPVSTLDVVPVKEGGKATVYFKGKPLAGVEVIFVLPDGKEKYLTTDAGGALTFSTAGRGLHVLKVAGHSEETGGTHEGKNYTVISHNSSLSWVE